MVPTIRYGTMFQNAIGFLNQHPLSQLWCCLLTMWSSANQCWIARHLVGQYFFAPSTSPHTTCALSSDSFFGMSSSMKYISEWFIFLIKCSLAVSLSVSCVTSLAISKTCNDNTLRILKEELSCRRSVWENLDRGREYRPDAERSEDTTESLFSRTDRLSSVNKMFIIWELIR